MIEDKNLVKLVILSNSNNYKREKLRMVTCFNKEKLEI